MKRHFTALLSLCLLAGLAACGAPKQAASPSTEITVFAAASLQESLGDIIKLYQTVTPDVSVVATYDSSGTLKTQIQEGAPCDLFISAAPKQLDALDGALKGDPSKNPDGLDFVVQGSRMNLLENKVVLAVPDGNSAGIENFDQLADRLKDGSILLAIGNSDVPVGQYTQKIFTYYGMDEAAVSGCLTYGSNAREVTTQISEAVVDCGIIYGTDAHSAGLSVVDSATAEMCGQVLYPAAVINSGSQPEAAQAFLDYLSTDAAKACFESVGFTPLT